MKLKLPMMPMPGRPRPARPPKAKLNAVVRASARAAQAEDFEDDDEESEPNMKLSHAFMVVLVLHVVAVGGVFAFNSIKTKQAQVTQSAVSTSTKTEAPATAQNAAVSAKAETAVAQKAPVAAAPAKIVSPKVDGTHEVTSGETLNKIATTYGVTVESLEKENGLSTYSTIKVGQRLKIPVATKAAPEVKKIAAAPVAPAVNAAVKPAATTTAAVTAKPAPVTTAPVTQKAPATAPTAASGGSYTVAKGDNPYSIAKKLKITYAELLKANNIDDPKKLQIGQKLIIPKK